MSDTPKSLLATRKLTQTRLKELANYDETTGLFRRKLLLPGGIPIGSIMGHNALTRGKHYVRIRLDGELIMAHVLAWLYTFGEWPTGEIDHIDGDGANNAIANLRLVSRTENNQNSSKRKHNTTGFTNVFKQANGRYTTRIKFNKVTRQLGTYATAEEASAVYEAAKANYAYGPSHGKQTKN